MATTAWKLGAAATQDGAGTAWSNIDRVLARAATPGAGTAASVLNTGSSKFIVVTGFDFSDVPDNATVNGFEIRINAAMFGSSYDAIVDRVYLRKDGVANAGNNFGPNYTALPGSFTDKTFGSSSSLGGLSWSVAELKAVGFAIAVGIAEPSGENSTNAYVESVDVRVTYTPSALPPAPVVSGNTASAAYGVGGTVQMSATNSPTSWSLTGTPPAGVSINSSGLVTWTGVTPVGAHSVGVRATNAGGDGDGTLALTITAATLTVTANNKSRASGAANPTFDGTIAGFVNGETSAVLTGAPSYTTAADTNSAPGTYPIVAAVGTLAATNYTFTFVNGTLTVTVPPPVVTGGSLTRAYGVGGSLQLSATNSPTSWDLVTPPAGVTISGSGLVTVAASTAAQVVDVTVRAGNAGGLGTAVFALTITKVALTVTARDYSRLPGTANPTFDGTITGFVNGETSAVLTGAPSYTTVATPQSLLGTYPIVAALGTLAATNYTFTFVNGVLSIVPATVPAAVPAHDIARVPVSADVLLARAGDARRRGLLPPGVAAAYDALFGGAADSDGVAARRAAFARILRAPDYATLLPNMDPTLATEPAPAPGVYVYQPPTDVVFSVRVAPDALAARDGRVVTRAAVAVTAPGSYVVPGAPGVVIDVVAIQTPATLDVTVRRLPYVSGGIGPGGDNSPRRIDTLLAPAVRADLFGAAPSGVYADAARLAESDRYDARVAGILIAILARAAAS